MVSGYPDPTWPDMVFLSESNITDLEAAKDGINSKHFRRHPASAETIPT